MSIRRVAQIALLAIVAVTLVLVLRPREDEASVAEAAVSERSAAETTFVAYYFHGDRRCDTCRSIESQAESAVTQGFVAELATGALEWQTVNTDRPENAHFSEEFGLTHSTLVLVERDGDVVVRFEALDRVWELVHEEDEFQGYVQEHIASWVESGS